MQYMDNSIGGYPASQGRLLEMRFETLLISMNERRNDAPNHGQGQLYTYIPYFFTINRAIASPFADVFYYFSINKLIFNPCSLKFKYHDISGGAWAT